MSTIHFAGAKTLKSGRLNSSDALTAASRRWSQTSVRKKCSGISSAATARTSGSWQSGLAAQRLQALHFSSKDLGGCSCMSWTARGWSNSGRSELPKVPARSLWCRSRLYQNGPLACWCCPRNCCLDGERRFGAHRARELAPLREGKSGAIGGGWCGESPELLNRSGSCGARCYGLGRSISTASRVAGSRPTPPASR